MMSNLLEDDLLMDACIYARKSTNKLAQKETIDNQIRICRYESPRYKLRIVDVKKDTGTGTDDLNRPEVKELIHDAIAGKYKCIIMKGISRFFRDVEKGLHLIKLLDRHGIRIVTIEENFDSKYDRTVNGKLDTSKITMYLMFAEMESKKTSERVKLQQLEKAARGEWNQAQSVPFGMKYNPDTKKIERKFPENHTIKLIFDLYDIHGYSLRRLEHYLEGDNPENKIYMGPNGPDWNQHTIKYILTNEAYVGDVVYNKRSKKERYYVTPELFGKTQDDVWIGYVKNDPSQVVVCRDAHEATVSREQFGRVANILASKASRKGIRNNVGLLATIAKCAECGAGMTFKRGNKNAQGWIKTKDNYYCMDYIRYGKRACGSHHVGAAELESMVINDLKELRTNKEMLDQIFAELRSSIPNKHDALAKERARIEKAISQISVKTNKLLEKNLSGDISDEQFKMMNENYRNELDGHVQRLNEIKSLLSMENNEAEKEAIFRNRIDQIASIDNMTKEQIRLLLLQLIDKIEIDKSLHVRIFYKFAKNSTVKE